MKKIGIKKMAPRISEKTFKFLAKNFQSANFGAELLLDSFPDLSLLTLRKELAGKFSVGELSFLIDIYNGTMLMSAGLGQTITAQVEDSFELYPDTYEKKWKIIRKKTEEKVRSLTYFQAACLEIWATSFWYGGGAEREECNFDAYLKTLL